MEERLETIDRELDTFETNLALPTTCPVSVQNRATELLGLEPAELSRMSAIDCGEAAVVLEQYAFYLQRVLNRETGRMTAANKAVKRMLSGVVVEQKGWSYEERILAVARGNEAAQKALNAETRAELRIERLAYLSTKVAAMARALMSLRQAKQGRYDQ